MQNNKRIAIIATIVVAILAGVFSMQTTWFDQLFASETTEPNPTTQRNSLTTEITETTGKTTTNFTESTGTTTTGSSANAGDSTTKFEIRKEVDETGVSVTITNRAKEKVGLSAVVRAGKRDAQGYAEIGPNETGILTIAFPQLEAKETLTLEYRVGTLTGERNEVISETLLEDRFERVREVPEELANAWNKGTFETLYDSLDYHFKKHGAEIDASNIVEYLEKSVAFRNQILKDKKDMQPSDLEKTYTIKVSSGKTPAHKYKHKVDKRYAILTDDEEKILSFGGK